MFKRKANISLDEIHQYTLDLERITFLRDKASEEGEINRYTIEIELMQKVLERLLEQVE